MISIGSGQTDGRGGLAGLLDSLPSMSGLADKIDSYKADLSARIGTFLQNDLKLRDANESLDEIRKKAKPEVLPVLEALTKKSAALKAVQGRLTNDAIPLIQQLVEFKSRIQTTSPMKELLAGTITLAGALTTAVLTAVTQASMEGAALMNRAAAAMVELDMQNAAVAKLAEQVEATKGGRPPGIDEVLLTSIEKIPAWAWAGAAIGLALGVMLLKGNK